MTAREANRPMLDGVRVLLVDDEAGLRAPIARYLRRRGAWVTEACDGAHALRRIERETFDAVVLDVGMPVMDGLQLLAELERRRHPVVTRVIYVTGDAEALTALRVDPAFAGRVFAKPVELPALEAVIAAVASSSEGGSSTSARAAADR